MTAENTILLIEKRSSKATTFAAALKRKGYNLEVAQTGSEALSLAPDVLPVLVILNAASLGSSGVRICRRLHDEVQKPIIHIIDEDVDPPSTEDRNSDILLKLPFTARKLVNRIKRLMPADRKDTVEAGHITFVESTRVVRIPGRETRLTPKAASLLEVFLEHPGKTLDRGYLMRQVWNTDYVGDTRTLDVHVRWVRQAIEPEPASPEYIRTVRGVGYRFESNTPAKKEKTDKKAASKKTADASAEEPRPDVEAGEPQPEAEAEKPETAAGVEMTEKKPEAAGEPSAEKVSEAETSKEPEDEQKPEAQAAEDADEAEEQAEAESSEADTPEAESQGEQSAPDEPDADETDEPDEDETGEPDEDEADEADEESAGDMEDSSEPASEVGKRTNGLKDGESATDKPVQKPPPTEEEETPAERNGVDNSVDGTPDAGSAEPEDDETDPEAQAPASGDEKEVDRET